MPTNINATLLEDKDGNKLIPITKTNCVMNDEGQPLNVELDDIKDSIPTFTPAQMNALNSGITAEKVTDIATNTTARHTHANKGVLDTITGTTQTTVIGIDNVVTASSNNLVTSGAVYNVLGDIETLLRGLR